MNVKFSFLAIEILGIYQQKEDEKTRKTNMNRSHGTLNSR
jgi:hypothetical protein